MSRGKYVVVGVSNFHWSSTWPSCHSGFIYIFIYDPAGSSIVLFYKLSYMDQVQSFLLREDVLWHSTYMATSVCPMKQCQIIKLARANNMMAVAFSRRVRWYALIKRGKVFACQRLLESQMVPPVIIPDFLVV